jgi:hypothetical protein
VELQRILKNTATDVPWHVCKEEQFHAMGKLGKKKGFDSQDGLELESS